MIFFVTLFINEWSAHNDALGVVLFGQVTERSCVDTGLPPLSDLVAVPLSSLARFQRSSFLLLDSAKSFL